MTAEVCACHHSGCNSLQGSLILKILRGKYPPLTGYSKELTDIVKCCLTLVSFLCQTLQAFQVCHSRNASSLPLLATVHALRVRLYADLKPAGCCCCCCCCWWWVSQDASKRPGTKSLLALKSVREHAQALGIELPPLPPPSEF
jgi:streptolysin S family bacteriocin protoxin